MKNNTRTSLFGSWSYRLILTLTVLAFTTNARPQAVSAYAFAQSAGTYASITGGTALSGSTWDNTIYTVSIPSFPFAGAYHTTMYVSTNGFIAFGSAPAANEFNPISTNAGYAGAIAAFGADIENSSSGSPLIRWEQVGSDIVVQWTEARRQDISGERISFQIRLNTTTGAINIVYGGTIAPASSTSNYPMVGLRGPNNSFPMNVNNRRVDTSSGSGSTWANTAAGTDNDSECRFNNQQVGRAPVVGQTYSWTPPCLPPTASAAGADQAICTTTGSVVTMAANTPIAGTGSWSQVSGTAATITTPNSPTTTITGLTTSGARTFRWSISTGASCTSNDDVVIAVNAPPSISNAGPDQTMCVTGTTPLAANSASPGTGAWTILAGSPSTSASQLSSTSSPTATFNPSGGAGIYTLRWTTSNSPCTATQDDVVITVIPTPTASAAGPDQTLCASSAILAANIPAVGVGAWSIISVPAGASNSLGQFSNTAANNATFTPSLMVAGAYTLRWTISNGSCTASTDNVVINWNAPPVASFTPVDDCANAQFSVEVNVSSYGTGSVANLQYTVNGGAPTSMANIGMGVTTIGPFAVGSEVTCTVNNGQGLCSPLQAVLYSNCAVTIPCGTTLVVNHCYRNNDTRTFLFTSSNPFETVTVTFIAGTMAPGDVLQAYSGTDETGIPLSGLTGSFPSLTNASATSIGPSIFIKIASDGSNSCATGQQTSWQFEAECTAGCVDPDGVVNVTTNCGAYNFGIDVEVLSVGDGSTGTTTLQYTVNGGTTVQIPGLTEFQVQNIGPFAVDDVVNVRLLHPDSATCNKNLGDHTDNNSCPSAENCVNALNLAMQISPLPGTTVGRVNDFSIACGTASANTAADAIYFIDVPNGYQFNMRQQTNNYNSQHYMRYGGACPGANVIACVNDDNGEVGWVMWTNTTGSTQRVWWIQDGSGTATGTYTLEWQLLSCPIPAAAAATGVTNVQATANFIAPAGNYIVEWGPAATFTSPGSGAVAGANGTVITTTTSPVLITGLSANTQYRYFVRRNCGGGSFSPNSTEILFTTTNAPAIVANGACGLSLAIPDDQCGVTELGVGVAISGQSTTLGTAPLNSQLQSVALKINHTWRGDVRVRLTSPSGVTRNLYTNRQQDGSFNDSGNNIGNASSTCPAGAFILRDGTTPMPGAWPTDAVSNVSGTFAPEQTLAGFNGGNANGTWVLHVCDSEGGDTGTLTHLSLNFATVDCAGVPGGTALPGTACNDGNACTINDTWTAGCACVGTFQDTDDDGTCNANDGCPNDPAKIAPGACGCGVADVPETYYADTDGDGFGAGVPVAGFTCSTPAGHVLNNTDLCPADPLKQVPGICGCGVADVPETYYPDTDGDGFGAGDPVAGFTCTVPGGHVTNNTDLCPDDAFKQSPGACGCGTTDVPETYYADTDGDGFGGGDPVPGFTCIVPVGHVTSNSDLCPNDPNKTAPGICGCGVADVTEVYYADTDGDGFGAGDPVAGFTCIVPGGHVTNSTDLCPDDASKQAPGQCGCGNLDTDSDGDLTADCNDLCPLDPSKIAPGQCGCGNPDTDTDGDSIADCVDACPLDPNNDQDNDGICGDIDTCPTVFGQVGNICDANPGQGFTLGALNSSCVCAATTCSQNLTIEFQTDMQPYQITWELREQGTNTILQGGAPLVAPNGIQTISTCVPNGCYFLKVMDAGGDGIANGGYILRTAGSPGTRIIDNRRNFNSGAVSQIAGNEGFCIPIGTTTAPIYTSCDKLDWTTGEYVVCSASPAVSALWNAGNTPAEATTGYEFQIFNPNGGYIFNRFRAHNQSDLFSPDNATRACHMKINNWAAAQHVPANVLMNVRIRTRINGVNGNWGPACRLKIDPVRAACPLTKLMDIPGDNNFSCNSTRMWGTGNYIHARPVSGATQYQWRFRIDAENFISIRTTTTYFIQLNWITLPLQNGKTYQVEVRAFKGGAWCIDTPTPAPGPNYTPWGDQCLLTIDNTPMNGGENFTPETSTNTLHMYPNPNRGDQVYVNLEGVEEDVRTVSVEIVDLYGKRVDARTIAVNDGLLNTVLDLDGTMANGLYMVNITAGEHRYSERLVIQR